MNAIHFFVFLQNGTEMDLQNRLENAGFLVQDDLPFPLNLSSPSK